MLLVRYILYDPMSVSVEGDKVVVRKGNNEVTTKK
jgi:hypothetical protein